MNKDQNNGTEGATGEAQAEVTEAKTEATTEATEVKVETKAEAKAEEPKVTAKKERSGIMKSIRKALAWYSRQFAIAYAGSAETLLKIVVAVLVSVGSVVLVTGAIMQLASTYLAANAAAIVTTLTAVVGLFCGILLTIGAARMERVALRIESGFSKVGRIILTTALVGMLVGFAVQHASDKDVVTTFYKLKYDNAFCKWAANQLVDHETETVGPFKVARCNGGIGISWYGKWVQVRPATVIDLNRTSYKATLAANQSK